MDLPFKEIKNWNKQFFLSLISVVRLFLCVKTQSETLNEEQLITLRL